jgi:hypothetical protein
MANVLLHFDVLAKKSLANMHVRCKFCAKEFHGNKDRMRNHLAATPNSGVKPCPSAPQAVQSIFSAQEKHKRKRSNSPTPSTASSGSTSSSNQVSMQLTLSWHANLRKNADDKWAEFCYAEGIPFSKFESHWFAEAIKASIAVGPTYCLPNPRKLSGPLLQEVKRSVEDKLKKLVFKNAAQTGECIVFLLLRRGKLIFCSGISLVTDGKDCNDHVHLINVILCTPMGASFYRTAEFGTSVRDAENTAQLFTLGRRCLWGVVFVR